jgi:DNA-binding HxlR family transcriptional regulator
MKDLIDKLNKLFDSRVRLGIMSLLMVNEKLDYNHLKKTLDITDGNLASHLSALEKAEYITFEKSFAGRKPITHYAATEAGKTAFIEHLDALERIIGGMK